MMPNGQLSESFLLTLTPEEREALFRLGLLDRRQSRIEGLFPDNGPLRRELYPKHIKFFDLSADHEEICLLSGNRCGKTVAAAYAMTCHLTGIYPEWWAGRRFDHAIEAWAASDTTETTRDILQLELLGKLDNLGTGMIPARMLVGQPTMRRGITGAVDSITVKNVNGGVSTLGFKAFEQGRRKFQGTAREVVWLDEECPEDIYDECLMRTMTTNGLMLVTFTPLSGLTAVVMRFLPHMAIADTPSEFGIMQELKDIAPPAESTRRACVQATWDDAPHLDPETKAALWRDMPIHQRDARSKGIPALGSGAIYPIAEAELLCEPFLIPAWYEFCFGLDVGWNRTAAVWGARDTSTDVLYLWAEHYRGQAEPALHAQAIRAKGDWIPGVIDPASRGRAQNDGAQLLSIYQQLGCNLTLANNAVESGIYEVMTRMSTGRLKIFKTLQNLRAELRLYRRDEKGHIVKENDHAMDALRYMINSGIARGLPKPAVLYAAERKGVSHQVEYDPTSGYYHR